MAIIPRHLPSREAMPASGSILVVDDDAEVRDMITEYLSTHVKASRFWNCTASVAPTRLR